MRGPHAADKRPAPALARVAAAPSAVASQPVARGVAPSTPSARGVVQRFADVSSPNDRAEVEAVHVARTVMRMNAPSAPAAVAARSAAAIHRAALSSAAPPRVAGAMQAKAPVSGSTGNLPSGVRSFMEPRLGADFSGVRVHTDAAAAQRSTSIDAHAYTTGKDIHFAQGRFQPDTPAGKELIAHELTHTIQQGAVRQVAPAALAVRERPAKTTHRSGGILDWFADKANYIPGFRMFCIVLGMNPINMGAVDRSAANVLRAVIEFIPGGKAIGDALASHGIFDRIGAWVDQKLRELSMVGGSFKSAIDRFVSGISATDILWVPGWGDLWERAKRIFTEPIDRIKAFVSTLATEIVQFIREAILLPLAALAEGTRGYDLLKAVLGEDPVTGHAVPRNAETLIGGFMKLVGQEDVWENVKKSGAIPRAWAWFQSALAGLLGFVKQIPTLAVNAFKSLEVTDMILVPRAFAKIAGVFGNFIGQFITWAGNAAWTLLEIIFAVVSPATLTYLKKTGAALKSILKNPLPFVRNLVNAAKLGLQNFADNFVGHLKAGLIDWLTGSLEGVYIPKALSLLELGKFAISVLGVSWAQIRAKMVKVLGPAGETIMKGLETGFDIVVALVKGGPAAAWELIKEKLTDLKDQVVSGIIGFVTDTVVKKAIPKLVSMFIPGAGFISAIISIYDTIMVFVEKMSKIVQVITAFVDSIVTIAGGNIAAAAKRVESVLGGLLSLSISFLAGFLGLGKVTDKIKEVIQKVRGTVDKAIDAAIAWVVDKAKKLFGKFFGKKDKADERTDAQKTADAQAAEKDAEKVLAAKGATPSTVAKALPDIKKKYRLTSIELSPEKEGSDKYLIEVVINPRFKTPGVTIEEVITPTFEVKWAVNKSGVAVACKAILTEVHVGAKRSSKEKSAQLKSGKSGKKGDQGGHIVGHRFIGEHGLLNMFPQNARFNVSDWKVMENEWARKIGEGYGIELAIFFTDYVGVRPSTISVKWSTYDIATDKTVEKFTEKFTNTKHQT
jgi:hypothetical protein